MLSFRFLYTLLTDRSATKAKVIIWFLYPRSTYLLTRAKSVLTVKSLPFFPFSKQRRTNISLAVLRRKRRRRRRVWVRFSAWQHVQVRTSEAACTLMCRDGWSEDGAERGQPGSLTQAAQEQFSRWPRPGGLPCPLRPLPPSSLLKKKKKHEHKSKTINTVLVW